jgi:hypothetical protein
MTIRPDALPTDPAAPSPPVGPITARCRRSPLSLTKHAKAAPFKRNDVLPIGVLVFPGTGIQENRTYEARKLGIPMWKFGNRGA